ncbi:Phage integrase, N-terminal SAM-like domain [Allopseudospirillum japonicum]|uniref:Phage integrase, N-terminal SAM-like domain n=1 Tax=Allopseudospirillum japonicum TaxID=64971 RepID=A0A1H6TW13_9GAMM|nr:phage integrase N-terminal SAM-like domain-containing protein [Allopseudospirillum japonicum]SEI79932.1 Phage integrase, N-terminal SAM-like domain [Allopseudospirillum japonicum]
MATKPRFLDLVRERIRTKHYSIRTEKAYIGWIKIYIFYNKRHPAEMGQLEMEQFLTYLAVKRNLASSTQNQA